MLEKEIKILEIDRKQLEEKLLSLGAVKTFEWVIHDVYYDFPDNDVNKMEANGRMFRLRKKGEEHIYTIKNKRKDVIKKEKLHAKEEHETPITNIESFAKVLEKYGMKKIREKRKHRISYSFPWENIEFDFDCYEGIPELLEIEGKTLADIKSWIKKLSLENHPTLRGGSRKIYAHYNIPYSYFDEDEI